MPHKHTRRKGDDQGDFDLPPTAIAKPLSAFDKDLRDHRKKQQKQKQKQQHQPQSNLKRKNTFTKNYREDDTPRAFARAMLLQQSGQKRRSGLDDGTASAKRPAKKQKTGEKGSAPVKTPGEADGDKTAAAMPRILPGERLRDFAARVDQALPVSGLARKGKVNVEGMKERQTRKEKQMHKMYAAWREEDARIKEQLEEQQELDEEAEEEREAALGGSQSLRFPEGRKAKRRRMIGEQKDGDDDPWAELKNRREAPRGLHDVVQAPPTLQRVREKFKTSNGAKVDVANIPVASGSLKRREELSSARKEVIERYRAMMKRGDS